MSLSWKSLVAIGVLSVVAGIVLIAWPGPSLLAIGLIVGIDLFCVGCWQLFNAIASPLSEGHRVSTAVIAGVEIVAGLIFLARPDGSLSFIAVALGVCFLVMGVLQLIVLGDAEHRGSLVARSVIDLLIGAVLVIWPEFGLASFAIVAGIGLALHGSVAIAAGLALRHEQAAGGPLPPRTPRLA